MKTILFLLSLIYLTIINAQTPNISWTAEYSYYNWQARASAIAVDATGNVYVTGSASDNTGNKITTIKYNSNGVQQWKTTYPGYRQGDSQAEAIVVDLQGNVYVAGYEYNGVSTGYDFIVIKYNNIGVQQLFAGWQSVSNDKATALTVDNSGNVYVTGNVGGGIITTKYNSSGTRQWYKNFYANVSFYSRTCMVLDASGNVLITSSKQGDYVTIKYNNNGVQQWESNYNGTGNGDDMAFAITADPSGNVYITGRTYNGTNSIPTTIKYNNNGVQQWVKTYNGSVYGHSIGLDASGNVYVACNNFATIKYNNNGTQQWVKTYNPYPGNSLESTDMKTDASGNVYVTGYTEDQNAIRRISTVKYNNNGIQQWAGIYTPSLTAESEPSHLSLDLSGCLYVTGTNISLYKYLTIKYCGILSNVPNLPLQTDIKIYPNPFNDMFYLDKRDNNTPAIQLTVLDLNGNQIIKETYEAGNNHIGINTQNWETGSYLVTIRNKQGELLGSYKLVKQ